MDQLIKFVGGRLKELRKTQGWTQERLSQESGINPSYIADVERGERNITLKSFDRLINALGVTPFVLVIFFYIPHYVFKLSLTFS
ncbi:helix-turn-helix domain-containing protein [Bacillus pumilus]|uniref:helix-turn-helix domain-containing protein n=1 Tax=Bacillus pumilus TaxID=1408 RepID=UPI001C92F77F|nr:helix-turn-helix transcriptional regulator [Bacillus pumilus]